MMQGIPNTEIRNTASILVRIFQGTRAKRMKENYYEELAHTMMKAEKSLDLPSASCRPSKVGE